MKNYYNEGILSYEFLLETFCRMLPYRKGRLNEVLDKVAKEVLSEYEEELYECSYTLEGYINEITRELPDIKNYSLREVIHEAGLRCLRQDFHDNLYTFLENYVEFRLSTQGVSAEVIDSIPVYEVIGYVNEGDCFEVIWSRIEEYLR